MRSILHLLLLSSLIVISSCGQKPTETVTQDNPPVVKQGFLPIASSTAVLEANLPSPRKEMTATIDGADIKVNYGSPAVKDRVIWGSLVPFNKVWRTGANEATRFTTSKDIEVAGQTLPAGTYGLFTLPGEKEWQVIFNKTADQWGAYEYDDTKDVLRVPANPRLVDATEERLEFVLSGNNLVLQWEKLRLPIAVGNSATSGSKS